jgi:hypothetical protein
MLWFRVKIDIDTQNFLQVLSLVVSTNNPDEARTKTEWGLVGARGLRGIGH